MKTGIINFIAVLFITAITVCSCTPKEPKVLTVYYSNWGGTEILANTIHESVGGDIFVIEPVTPYPKDGTHAIVQKHIEENFLPPLKQKVEGLEKYDVIYIGSPNWFNTMSLPVKAFLQENDLAGKTVIPFATFGGSVGETLNDITKALPNSTVLTGFAVSGDEAKGDNEALKAKVEKWLDTVKPEYKK